MKNVYLFSLLFIPAIIASENNLNKAIEKLDVNAVKEILSKKSVFDFQEYRGYINKIDGIINGNSKLTLKKNKTDLAKLVGGTLLTTVSSMVFVKYLYNYIKLKYIMSEKNDSNLTTDQIKFRGDYDGSVHEFYWLEILSLCPANIYAGIKLIKSGWNLESAKKDSVKAEEIKSLLNNCQILK